ncbi:hypothetical protein GCM10012289_18170 [Nonomuraea cavernae]|uniref:Uncharacterized protein n=2 Tax=Nonomuraea cavernae TaxID=2045107 RepID=A0A917YTB0_9ACTN|nr:hypothetical protein GCM10012289_18170 [Nonomuraea cavernae]
MTMTPPRRRIALTIATFALAGLTTACGAIGNAVDCNAVAQEITTISNEFSTSLGSAATDPDALKNAATVASDKANALAGKYDGELGSSLKEFAGIFDSFKSNDVSEMTAATSKLSSFQTKITSACS